MTSHQQCEEKNILKIKYNEIYFDEYYLRVFQIYRAALQMDVAPGGLCIVERSAELSSEKSNRKID